MQPPDVISGNILIAEFLKLPTTPMSNSNEKTYLIDHVWYGASHLTYHSSWNELMPVWKKFLCEAEPLLYANDKIRSDTMRVFHNCVDMNNCSAAQRHLVSAIQWYNTQQQNITDADQKTAF